MKGISLKILFLIADFLIMQQAVYNKTGVCSVYLSSVPWLVLVIAVVNTAAD